MLNIRGNFKILENDDLIYFDNAATSLTPNQVVEAMSDYYYKYRANINRSVSGNAYIATEKYEETRGLVQSFINAEKEKEIIFAKGTTSLINSLARVLVKNVEKKDEIIFLDSEHHANSIPWIEITKEKEMIIKIAPTNQGKIMESELLDLITNKTKIISINMISNVFGRKNNLEKIIKLIKQKNENIIIIIDAAQAISHCQVDVQKINCDFLVFSGHKVYGPTGVGVLYGKEKELKKLEPFEYGGEMVYKFDEKNMQYKDSPMKFEAGTPPIAEVIGLGSALKFINEVKFKTIIKIEEELKSYLFSEMSNLKCVEIYNSKSDIPLMLFNIKGVHAHDASGFYDEDKIALRSGHHCNKLSMKKIEQKSSLRISLSFYNTKEEIDKFIEATKKIILFFEGVK